MDKIVLENVSYTYPISKNENLRNINLRIKEGEFCSVIGPNGAGKTTLLNAIRGFVPKFYDGKFSGRVLVDGKDISSQSLGDLAIKMGYLFQNPFAQISGATDTVFEEIAFGLENIGIEPSMIVERIRETMSLLKIDHLKDRNPFDLSGGQQQKVAFASVLAMNPSIFVIDEPTSQLDPEGTEQIFEIIELLKMQKKTIVLAEQKMELIAKYAEHVVLIYGGEITLDGTAKEVMTNKNLENIYKTAMSKYALLARELNNNGFHISDIPINEDEAKALFRKEI